jgi:predicted kinase
VGRVLAAHRLHSRQAVYLEVDALFLLLLPESDRNRQDRRLAYDAAHAPARTVVDRGRLAILECTYARREQRGSLSRALSTTSWAPLWVVELAVAPDDAVQRFRRRRDATDLDEGAVRERAENFPYSREALQLQSSAAPPDDLADAIAGWLRRRPRPVDRNRWAAEGRPWR